MHLAGKDKRKEARGSLNTKDYKGQSEARVARESSARAYAELEGRAYDDYEEVEDGEDEDGEDEEFCLPTRKVDNNFGGWGGDGGAGSGCGQGVAV